MSKFIKGTSIVGALAISVGIWQLTESEGIGKTEKTTEEEPVVENSMKADNDGTHSYETVTIQNGGESSEDLPVERSNDGEQKLLEDEVVQGVKDMVSEQERIGTLINEIGKNGLDADFSSETDTYDWKAHKKENDKKYALIEELLELSDDETLNDMAKEARSNFARSLDEKNLDFYLEAIKEFQYLSEKL